MGTPYLLFDLGNVIVDLDIPATYRALADLTRGRARPFERFLQEERWLDRYETGALSDQEFIAGILDHADPDTPPEAVVDAWNAMLVHIPSERLEWLADLRSRYQVGLLSNTNGLHLQWVHDYLDRQLGIRDFEDRCFDEVYYSHRIGYRKPAEECFRHTIRAIGRPAREILFIDDLEDNTAAARACGMRAATHPAGREIREWLDHYLQT
jgi:glucose-1-phosphatase